MLEIESVDALLKEPANRLDPYPLYRSFREAGRLKTKLFDAWVLPTHADVAAVLRDPRLSTNNRHQLGYDQFREMAEQLELGRILNLSQTVLLFLDPPDHTRIRRLVGKAFSVRAVEAMRPHIQELVDCLLEPVVDKHEMDVIADVAFPLPVTVISEMLGIPPADHDQLHEWTSVAVKLTDPGDDFSVFAVAEQVLGSFDTYFRDQIDDRRRNPGDDLLTALIQVEDEGQQLNEVELVSTMMLLYIAGHETTVNLVGNGLLALLRHPDQQDLLRKDPSLVPTAVEEMLRYDSPVQLSARNAIEDVEIDGMTFTRGQQAVLLLGAANRDETFLDGADEFRIDRKENRHLAFGGGIHLCLGAPLARLEAQVVLGSLVDRLPFLELQVAEPPRKDTVTLRGLTSLPVGW